MKRFIRLLVQQWRLSAPFESGVRGPVWLTGGGFGPEDSVINIVVMACALGGLGWAAWRKGSFSTGSVAAGRRAG